MEKRKIIKEFQSEKKSKSAQEFYLKKELINNQRQLIIRKINQIKKIKYIKFYDLKQEENNKSQIIIQAFQSTYKIVIMEIVNNYIFIIQQYNEYEKLQQNLRQTLKIFELLIKNIFQQLQCKIAVLSMFRIIKMIKMGIINNVSYLTQKSNFNIFQQQIQFFIFYSKQLLSIQNQQFQISIQKYLNTNQFLLEQLQHKCILKKLVNNNKESNQNFDLILDSFLYNQIKWYTYYEQFEIRDKLQIEQAQLIQLLTDELNKLQKQQINDEISKMSAQQKILYFESLKNKTIKFCIQIQNEIQIQTYETIENMDKRIKQNEQSNEYYKSIYEYQPRVSELNSEKYRYDHENQTLKNQLYSFESSLQWAKNKIANLKPKPKKKK